MKSKIYTPSPVSSIDQIDLDAHAIIEASAGTGKTYTIENLVVALLKSGKIAALEEVLVVTFTEKAASELKDRIRRNIKKELEKNKSQILLISLENFDSASIFTIHGFCNKILQEFAFENGEQFQTQLIDDRLVFEEMLYFIMREKWPERYRENLKNILAISQFPGSTAGGVSSWEHKVIEMALRYQPQGNDIFKPGSNNDLVFLIHEAEARCSACFDQLEQLVGVIDIQRIDTSDLLKRYSTLNINKNSMERRLRILKGLLLLIVEHRTSSLKLHDIWKYISSLDLGTDGFTELNTRWIKERPDYEEKLPRLLDIIRILEELRSIDFPTLQNLLIAITIEDIKRLSLEYKQSRGFISYDDMIVRVHTALTSDPSPSPLKKVLQKKYRYALVDEFQDTDMLQWKIFKNIFLHGSNHRLFIIGDPKQSIYGFRGADVHAYYIARDEMLKSFNARYYSLNNNWRSSPGLIEFYNLLFSGDKWFSDSNIRYLPNQYPEEKKINTHKNSRSICVLNCGVCNGTSAQYRSARHIARELRTLIHLKPVDLSSIAILVTKWKEAEAIEKHLQAEHIKYSYYKKEGLYQSKEVLELFYLLAAIASPYDLSARKKALITRFFRIPICQLLHYSDTDYDPAVSMLFARWIGYADQKNWPDLFQSIINDTGILFLPLSDDHERVLINYRSVLQNLEIEAYRNNYSIQDMLDYLTSLRSRDSSSHENYNIEAIDVDQPGVQILTIHASKGLEFDTVFIAGGFTKKTKAEFWIYHANNHRVFDLVMDPKNKEYYDLEINSEHERLFYVAMTRAKEQLYIPLFEPSKRSKNTAGILGKKLSELLKNIKAGKMIMWLDISSDAGQTATQTSKALSLSEHLSETVLLPDPLFPNLAVSFLDRKIHIDSFSGIKQQIYHHDERSDTRAMFGHSVSKSDDDDERFAIAETIGYDQLSELPRSKETGIMLHAILEQIDFYRAGMHTRPEDLITQDPTSLAIINMAIQRHLSITSIMDSNTIASQAAHMLWQTLNTSLDGSDLLLKNQHQKIHEVEFYYPAPTPSNVIPDMHYKNGFLHGFIDMIFIYQGKYFILDWKSNYIDQGYSPAILKKNIHEMHYDLQISIYFSAVIRWLKTSIADYNYNSHFGGIYYLYLRGMDSKNSQSGIYFFRPDNEQMGELIMNLK